MATSRDANDPRDLMRELRREAQRDFEEREQGDSGGREHQGPEDAPRAPTREARGAAAVTARVADWGLVPIAGAGAIGGLLGSGPFRLAGLWSLAFAARRLWAGTPALASARRSARLDRQAGRALLRGRSGTEAGPGAVEARDVLAGEHAGRTPPER
ncbi:MAG TPA: hypothetical protein VFE30_10545 [Anaeromyxobacteraceae bacterium]|jgi:hypothetical protein|nr:hypothetical protein [Anaeromyxobacteraceae bacterium]